MERLGYARSLLITAPLIFLYTAVMGSISVASSIVDSRGHIQHACSRIWARMILWTSRVRLRVTGIENIRQGTPYVLCVNHQSHMDIPIVLAAMPFQFRFAAKKELFRYAFLGWHLRRSGHVPIDRENPRAAVKSLREAAETIRKGTPVVIFPEGGTSLDGSIRPFKGGGCGAKSDAAQYRSRFAAREPCLFRRRIGARSSIEVIVGSRFLPAACRVELQSRP